MVQLRLLGNPGKNKFKKEKKKKQEKQVGPKWQQVTWN